MGDVQIRQVRQTVQIRSFPQTVAVAPSPAQVRIMQSTRTAVVVSMKGQTGKAAIRDIEWTDPGKPTPNENLLVYWAVRRDDIDPVKSKIRCDQVATDLATLTLTKNGVLFVTATFLPAQQVGTLVFADAEPFIDAGDLIRRATGPDVDDTLGDLLWVLAGK